MCCQIAGSENAFSQSFLLFHGPKLFRDSLSGGTGEICSYYSIGQRTPSECEAKHKLGKLKMLGRDILGGFSMY